MDALCFLRILSFGIKLSAMGMFHGIWLMPVYGTASVRSPLLKDDPIAAVSTQNIPSGSGRFIATAVAAYCIFIFTMWLMLREFEWFTMHRHEFLLQRIPRNFSVYVTEVPEELKNNLALQRFFQQGLAHNTVLTAQLALTAENLKALQNKRRAVLNKLEHAIDVESTNGDNDAGGRRGNSTDSDVRLLYRELDELNRAVAQSIDDIEEASMRRDDVDDGATTDTNEGTCLLDEDGNEAYHSTATANRNNGPLFGTSYAAEDSLANPSHHSLPDKLLDAFATVENVARETGRAVMELVSSEDGRILPAGFVTFTTLRGTHAALQMVQYPQSYTLKVSEAPAPDDVVWSNIGRAHQELKIFSIVSVIVTVAVCLLWTIPMAFIASIANVNGLRAEWPWLDHLLDKYPRLDDFFSQLAPMLIILAGGIMRLIAEFLTVWEGHISGAIVQARMFVKLYWFQIIQTFFISAISGSIWSVLSAIIETPSCLVQLLASSLPGQSSYFIQITLVKTFVGVGVELLRVSPIAQAILRSCIGPRLTERERQKTFMGLRPLADPIFFYHSIWLSSIVLYFMVFFVYAVIQPLFSYFLFACFVILKACLLHQFVCIYPTTPDSGGELWIKFMGFVPWGAYIIVLEHFVSNNCFRHLKFYFYYILLQE
jgi:hypothetical protein